MHLCPRRDPEHDLYFAGNVMLAESTLTHLGIFVVRFSLSCTFQSPVFSMFPDADDCFERLIRLAEMTWMHLDNFVGHFSSFCIFKCSVILHVTRRCYIPSKQLKHILIFASIPYDH